jgi:hypothetical protein
MSTELDQERIETICVDILQIIQQNFVRGPISRDRCLEALNALAAAAALVIHGADGPGGKAHEFFDQAFEDHLSEQ